MIVVDTSAIIAVVLDEPSATACMGVLEREPALAMSAGTLAECLLVAHRRAKGNDVEYLIRTLAPEVVDVTEVFARKVAHAHASWGRGTETPVLNFGDCFAYALATERGCPLLFVGQDFSRTDVASAL